MPARYYNPYICRFVNADPSGFAGGLNFYAFANGNPVGLTDPFGLGATEPSGIASWNIGTRALGALQVVGGLAQAAAGYTFGTVTAPTVAGGIVGATIGTLGLDQTAAGFQTLFTGQQTPTLLQSALQSSGLSPNAAAWTSAGINISLTGGAGVYSAYSSTVNSIPSIAVASSETSSSQFTTISVGSSEALMSVNNGTASVALGYVADQATMVGLTRQAIAQASAAGASSVVVDTGYVINPQLAAALSARVQSGSGLLGGTIVQGGTASLPRFTIIIPIH